MADVLIRNLSDDDVARIEEKAAAVGLSRNEYLRRRIEAEANRDDAPVGMGDLKSFAELGRDLGDKEVMGQAWS